MAGYDARVRSDGFEKMDSSHIRIPLEISFHLNFQSIDNGDGSGGSPPAMLSYVMINGDASNADVGFDPHAKTFIITNSGNYICTGVRNGNL